MGIHIISSQCTHRLASKRPALFPRVMLVCFFLISAGMMLPSLTSAVYFFVFLGLCTWWSWCRTFDPLLFGCLCVLLAIFTAGHLIGLYLYQFQFFQEAVPPNDYYAR